MNEQLLLVEDEEDLRMTLTDRLESEGYRVLATGDGSEGLQLALQKEISLLILDVMLPGKNGFDVCRDLRMAGRSTPVLMLTARGQVVDKVLGLKIGADDYLVKPFDMMELMARIEALLRRSASPAQDNGLHYFGELTVDLRGTVVTRSQQPVQLSAREFQLLRFLIQHRGTTLSRDVILKEVWGYSTGTFTRTVDVHIFSLRQKLENDPKNPSLILTVPGLGYKLAA